MRPALAALAVLALGLADAPRPLPPPILVRVHDADTQQPLGNAQVIERTGRFSRFTNAQGELTIVRGDSSALTLRVRQLGYHYRDTTIAASSVARDGVDTLRIALARVAYQVGGVRVRMKRGCDSIPSPALTVEALTQLQQGAERYLAFRATWPFEVRLTKRTAQLRADGSPGKITEEKERSWSETWGLPYRPGNVVDQRMGGFAVPLLFITALADSTFLDRHCFDARHVVEWKGQRVVRLSFWPDASVKEPDWEGVALIDSATSLLRRVDFQITGLGDDDLPRRFEGYTTFYAPTALVAFPESTSAIWWRIGPDRSGFWPPPNVAQILHLDSLVWRKGAPPPPRDP